MKKSKKRNLYSKSEELQLRNQELLRELILDYMHLRSQIVLKRKPQVSD